MNQFTNFVVNHWMLWLALVVIAALIILEETKSNIKGVQKVTPQGATDLINHQDAVVLDVRESEAFKVGHLVAAINVVSSELEGSIKKLNKYKNKPIIVIGASDAASVAAGVMLRKQGFEKVYLLAGGVDGWKRANLPLVKN